MQLAAGYSTAFWFFFQYKATILWADTHNTGLLYSQRAPTPTTLTCPLCISGCLQQKTLAPKYTIFFFSSQSTSSIPGYSLIYSLGWYIEAGHWLSSPLPTRCALSPSLGIAATVSQETAVMMRNMESHSWQHLGWRQSLIIALIQTFTWILWISSFKALLQGMGNNYFNLVSNHEIAWNIRGSTTSNSCISMTLM